MKETQIQDQVQLQEFIQDIKQNPQKLREFIELRKKIVASAASQLKNGVITSSAYITEITNLFEAENSMSAHKIELLLAKANYKTIKGI